MLKIRVVVVFTCDASNGKHSIKIEKIAKKSHLNFKFRRHFYSLIISLLRLLQQTLTYLDSINFDRLNSRRHDQHDCYNKEFTKADLHRD